LIISRTPYRISFFGGGTDYPIWYREHGGAVLATTINKYCYITCRYLPPFFEHKSRIVWSEIERVSDISQIQHPAVREALSFLGVDQGVEIHHDGDLPAKAGLGSSSSFAVGLLHALHTLNGVAPTKRQLALEAIHVERDRLLENVGLQDQVSTAFGGLNRVDFGGADEFFITPIALTAERLDQLQSNLMLFYTGAARNASDIAGEQIKATRQKKWELNAMYQMVDEGINLLTGKGDLCDFGRLLHDSWQLKRSLTNLISTPEVDQIYETALKSGAVGGKLLGAGGGGFMLFFVRPEDSSKVKESLNHLLHVPCRFESHGSQIIFHDAENPDTPVETSPPGHDGHEPNGAPAYRQESRSAGNPDVR